MSSTQLDPEPQPDPVPEAGPPIPGQQAAPAENEQVDKDLLDKSVTDHRGERVVPISTVKEERAKSKTLKAQVEQLSQRVQQLAQVEQNYRLLEPYLPQIAQFVQQQQQGGGRQQGPDPEVVEFARELGTDDLGTAEKLMRSVNRIVERRIATAVGPVEEQVAGVKAREMRERAYNATDPKTGRPWASRQAIDTVFRALESQMPKLAADPNVANVALLIARGLEPPRSAEPTLSETTGARGGRSDWTALGERAAKVLGVSADRFRQARGGETSGVLEEY